jgi:hypothetical protein
MSAQQTLAEQTLGFTKAAGEALYAAQQVIAEHEVQEKKAAERIPSAVDRLLATKLADGRPLITADQKDAALKKLATHDGALSVLVNVLDLSQEQIKQASQAAMLQQGEGMPAATPVVKQANAQNSPFVGARHGDSDQPESFRNFAAAMLGNR